MSQSSEPDFYVADEDDVRIAFQSWLDELGLTISEVRRQADEDEFSSESVRRFWWTFEGLGLEKELDVEPPD